MALVVKMLVEMWLKMLVEMWVKMLVEMWVKMEGATRNRPS
jgi:hypothetical protein